MIHLYVRDVAGLFINSLYGYIVSKSMVLQNFFSLFLCFFVYFTCYFAKLYNFAPVILLLHREATFC